MKTRAVLLLALVIGGAYAMFDSISAYNEKRFEELLESMDAEFHSLVFSTPPILGSSAETWVIDDEYEVDQLLHFLQDYRVKKLKPEEITLQDDIDEFNIVLKDANGNTITIVVNENLIIQNSMLYYKIVDGPLDGDWIVRFIASNRS
ncbi:hypothetical protein [Sporosarcina sp. Te-1]|uniref:hypothetical protein n=1 Tax=Sporosarcina sp. Te-1 TaxID=2818390 RepID=UPI001A9CDC28|nr:hypothetical protein [Sporosarcina sp. Te-1]QTD41331.1 hypothetical protein J3U78_00200 [Sporosarcina sp. Te-1]